MKGLTHVYYGYGKGKTTAALGLALRAAGTGRRVVLVQFLKDTPSGELTSLAKLENVIVLRGKARGGMFTKDMDEAAREATLAIHNANLSAAIALVSSDDCDLLILDEVIDAYQLNLIDATLLTELVTNKPEALELVITGHKPEPWIFDHADYITEMVKHKHPYDAGIPARKGVEF
ncbi:MAG: cob(I)yrinic acid a,c-diamide adenosyltransferase [Oscillospiraceae bacterium]|nr:cob(I)yrinic acid a,c-diamide adenosyltransferase [Oscillospiraceae bacterium]